MLPSQENTVFSKKLNLASVGQGLVLSDHELFLEAITISR